MPGMAGDRQPDLAGTDRAALVRNLKNYLQQFPDSPRKASVYQALIEACQQLHDVPCALNFAERLIAVQPDDSEIMMLATDLLQQNTDITNQLFTLAKQVHTLVEQVHAVSCTPAVGGQAPPTS